LANNDGRVKLAIRDDGAGFELADVKVGEHYGLTLMKERAELIGAQFDVQSRPGQGTTVSMAK
jgi:two-component system nitrate/nitrite sensor histidine kinase NarX